MGNSAESISVIGDNPGTVRTPVQIACAYCEKSFPLSSFYKKRFCNVSCRALHYKYGTRRERDAKNTKPCVVCSVPYLGRGNSKVCKTCREVLGNRTVEAKEVIVKKIVPVPTVDPTLPADGLYERRWTMLWEGFAAKSPALQEIMSKIEKAVPPL